MPDAHDLATALCEMFKHHDAGDRLLAVETMRTVDEGQFAHCTRQQTTAAAKGYVGALFAKDRLEGRAGDLATADWTPVAEPLQRRAAAAGIDARYVEETIRAWRRHKTGGDYWTPHMRAQLYEVRAALQQPSYPQKPSDGQHGLGALPARWHLGTELHDLHTESAWRQAVAVMEPYFARILDSH